MAKSRPYIWITIVSLLAAIAIGVSVCAIFYFVRFLEFNKVKQELNSFETEMVILKDHQLNIKTPTHFREAGEL